ncbi:hypothetical protein Tco_0861164 [Tanacetum coccineum]|uniref:Uncharacterized protein n=1 Tax=Tanacetum coccineum TaxID=301880 RepID=A0ABQ5BJZ6_9ASTR
MVTDIQKKDKNEAKPTKPSTEWKKREKVKVKVKVKDEADIEEISTLNTLNPFNPVISNLIPKFPPKPHHYSSIIFLRPFTPKRLFPIQPHLTKHQIHVGNPKQSHSAKKRNKKSRAEIEDLGGQDE